MENDPLSKRVRQHGKTATAKEGSTRLTPSTKVVSASKPAQKSTKAVAETSTYRELPARLSHGYQFDVCLSFAGENRTFVSQVARCLKRRGIHYFYDEEAKADLWGNDLYTYLDDIYRHKSRYCMVFLSKYYKEKRWTNHERQSAQARVFQDMGGYLLPVRLDATEIPGIRLTTGYLDGRKDTPAVIADTLRAKLNGKPAPVSIGKQPKLPKGAGKPSNVKAPVGILSRKVSRSGKWIMLGDHFWQAELVEEGSDGLVMVQINSISPRDEAELRSLGSRPLWQRKELPYAHGNDAAACQVQDVQVRYQNGKPTFTLSLKLERPTANPMEMNFNGMSADKIAEKRARLILLGERTTTGDRFIDSHIGHSFRPDHPLEAAITARTWKALAENTTASLQKTRLTCLYHLMASGIVEHIHDLILGPITRDGIGVQFEGGRHVRASNEPRVSVVVSGICPLPKVS